MCVLGGGCGSPGHVHICGPTCFCCWPYRWAIGDYSPRELVPHPSPVPICSSWSEVHLAKCLVHPYPLILARGQQNRVDKQWGAQRVDGVNSLCGLPPSPFGSLVPQSLLGRIRTSCSLWGHPLSQPTASSQLLTPALHLNPGSLAPPSFPPLPTPHISCPHLSARSPSLAPYFILSSDPLYSPGPQVELVKWGLPPPPHTTCRVDPLSHLGRAP